MEYFSKRLRDVIHALRIEDKEFATAGGVDKATLSGYIKVGRLPNQKTLANWVQAYGINAHWLLTGEGDMFQRDVCPLTVVLTPLAVRVDQLARLLGESGVGELEITRAARAMLDGELEKLSKERSGYGVREASPAQARAAEEPGAYPAPKAAGDDTV